MEAEKAPTDTKKAKLDTEEAKHDAEEAKQSSEEAKVILLKTKNYSEEAIAKFKLEAEQPKAILKKDKEATTKEKLLENK